MRFSPGFRRELKTFSPTGGPVRGWNCCKRCKENFEKGWNLKYECALWRKFNKFRVRGTRLTLPLAGKVSKGAVKGKPFRLGFPLTIPFLNDQEGLATPLDSP